MVANPPVAVWLHILRYKRLRMAVASLVRSFWESFLASPCVLSVLGSSEETVRAQVAALARYQDVRFEWRRSTADWVYAMRDETVDKPQLVSTIQREAELGLWGTDSLAGDRR